jgi:Fuc2NAc and GlcNAc transferase
MTVLPPAILTASLLGALGLSVGLTGWIRSYCLAKGIVDIPNQRSAHSRVVARGGGVGFCVVFLAAVAGLGAINAIPARIAIAIAGGGLAIAVTGWIDDRKSLSQVTRIVCHFGAAAWVVGWIGTLPPLLLGNAVWHWGWVGQLTTVAAVAWMVNLYNFMDGTDGIAAVECVTVAVMAGALCALAGVASNGLLHWFLAGSVAGFLVWNWPPARIFMGDAGSGFLGFTFAALILWSAVEDARLLWPCVILLAVFTVDATTTLLRRILRGERWYLPHSTHAYQKLARRLGHRPIAIGVAAITVMILGPVAWLAWLYPNFGFSLFLTVYLALAAVVLIVRDTVS